MIENTGTLRELQTRAYLYRKLVINLPAQRLECCASKLIGPAIPGGDRSASRTIEQ